MKIELLIFDWGDTIMKDFGFKTPMCQWKYVEWIDGAEEMLDNLRENYHCAIATSAPHSGVNEMKKALQRVGADKYFRNFFSGKEMGVSKPDPGFFTEICDTLKYPVASAVSIGNICEKDIAGARIAGLKTVLFDIDRKQFCSSADAVINDLSSLKSALEEL